MILYTLSRQGYIVILRRSTQYTCYSSDTAGKATATQSKATVLCSVVTSYVPYYGSTVPIWIEWRSEEEL